MKGFFFFHIKGYNVETLKTISFYKFYEKNSMNAHKSDVKSSKSLVFLEEEDCFQISDITGS